jgi:Protein of unknown function (DUF4038)/Putative collagen-binding domain of a collagenase
MRLRPNRLVVRILLLLCVLVSIFCHAAAAEPTYPLKVSANGRYLVDQNNVPYLMTGDSPQALIVKLSEAQADAFFANRRAHGFNTVWINLLCTTSTGGRADASNRDGARPFLATLPSTTSFDLTTPNEAYFAHVDRVINLAAKYGIQVLLDPIETIGFLSTILNNGTAKCMAYGQYLGNRYKNFPNIIWMSGNDFQKWKDSNADAVVRAVALGILDNDTNHLHTVELDYPVSGSLDNANWANIISLNASYTYYPTYAQVLKDYNRSVHMPTFMVEANYEFEDNFHNLGTLTPQILRRQEYWTMLSGATGQLYGNRYTWQFISGWLTRWQPHLDTTGSKQMRYLVALFGPRRWYDLIPDQTHSVVTAGYGTFSSTGTVMSNDYATAARTDDGTLVMVYLPSIRTVTVDMSKLSAPAITQWYDPSTGAYTKVPGSPFTNSGAQSFAPPDKNGDGDGDWVLLLETASSTPDTESKGVKSLNPL